MLLLHFWLVRLGGGFMAEFSWVGGRQSIGFGSWIGGSASPWVSGVGVHSGAPCRARVHRAPGEAVSFLVAGRRIPFDVSAVVPSRLCTTVGFAGARVGMIEHLGAALLALNLWSGLMFEVEGPELPVLDGSARGWLELLAGVSPEPAPPAFTPPASRVEVRGGVVQVLPGGVGLRLDVSVDFAHPRIGAQAWRGDDSDFLGLLDARTFGLASDLTALRAAGLGLGVRPENAVVYGDGIVTPEPRGEDEPVRHKALDLLGDLYLLGGPINALVFASRASHEAHVSAVRSLVREAVAV